LRSALRSVGTSLQDMSTAACVTLSFERRRSATPLSARKSEPLWRSTSRGRSGLGTPQRSTSWMPTSQLASTCRSAQPTIDHCSGNLPRDPPRRGRPLLSLARLHPARSLSTSGGPASRQRIGGAAIAPVGAPGAVPDDRDCPRGAHGACASRHCVCPGGAVWPSPARLLLGHGWSHPATRAARCRVSSVAQGSASRRRASGISADSAVRGAADESASRRWIHHRLCGVRAGRAAA
jgi:hypothetical protein